MGKDVVLVQREGPICTVTMNRPKVMNAFNLEMGSGLQDAFDRIDGDKEVRVVVLAGAGGISRPGRICSSSWKIAAPMNTLWRS